MGVTRRYPGYEGNKKWEVFHPAHGTITVTAPEETAALCIAAEAWGATWTDHDFYSRCEVWRS